MKINDVMVEKSQIDELTAGDVGQAAGKATRAVGTGIKNFAKGFAAGFKGQSPAASAAPKGASDPLASIKDSISKLSPKQRAALRTQIAKKAGVQ